nr:MAG TPA: hypothetical protein [Inoviridae sp.]DAM32367.1 MAG TPA: hypothetical protein [Inoviridae sp.]
MRNAVWSILQTSGCEIPGPRCSLGAGDTPFPLTTESARFLAVTVHHAMDAPTGPRT